MTDKQRKHLQTVIARLHREITVLLVKPIAQYDDPRKTKFAQSRRKSAIGDRKRQISDYQQRINESK